MAGLSAGVYMGTGELGGVLDCSYRVQWWDFRRLQPPRDLSSFDPWEDDDDGMSLCSVTSRVPKARALGARRPGGYGAVECAELSFLLKRIQA